MTALQRASRILQETAACLSSWRPRKPHGLAVLALFKNEAHALGEWVEHYAREGATAIHLVNNNSSDDYRRVLAPHQRSGLVVLHHDNRLHAQQRIYNDHLRQLRHQCDWLLVCDLDEFVYARRGHRNTLAYLRSLPPWVSGVQVPWKMFGSAGHRLQPSAGLRCGFQQRASADARHPCMPAGQRIAAKPIARSSRIRSLDVHTCTLLWGRRILPDGSGAARGSFQPISEALLERSQLHLNHYAVQSEQLFQAIKMTRGDVNAAAYASVRDMAYFRSYDINDINDPELAQRCQPH
ncbi:MAG: glycosyltransferase family 2 protein [Vulcanococcus sp.]